MPQKNRGAGHPDGIRHYRATHSFEVVEWLRELKYVHKVSERRLHELFPCISKDTLHDWLNYKTRNRA